MRYKIMVKCVNGSFRAVIENPLRTSIFPIYVYSCKEGKFKLVARLTKNSNL